MMIKVLIHSKASCVKREEGSFSMTKRISKNNLWKDALMILLKEKEEEFLNKPKELSKEYI